MGWYTQQVRDTMSPSCHFPWHPARHPASHVGLHMPIQALSSQSASIVPPSIICLLVYPLTNVLSTCVRGGRDEREVRTPTPCRAICSSVAPCVCVNVAISGLHAAMYVCPQYRDRSRSRGSARQVPPRLRSSGQRRGDYRPSDHGYPLLMYSVSRSGTSWRRRGAHQGVTVPRIHPNVNVCIVTDVTPYIISASCHSPCSAVSHSAPAAPPSAHPDDDH